ncbi:MAG: FAD-binding oxidoreductase [Flavobacteriales bacterium]
MHSIWETRGFHRTPHLVVVGAGIVGLFTALFHKRANPKHHVVVLERGPFPSGASVKNAGFACFGSPSELLADLENEGMDAMLYRVEERWRGLQELRNELGDAAIGLEGTGGYEIYAPHDHRYTTVAEGFDRLNEALRPIFRRTVFAWSDDAIPRMGLSGVEHMAKTDLEGPLDTALLMDSLLRKAVSEGVQLRPNSWVTSIEDGQDHVRVRLRNEGPMIAAQVVVATNGYATELLPELDVKPARGQVLLTTPIEGSRLRGTFHYDEGFYYFRDHHGAVLLGGGRNLDIVGETTTEDSTTPLIQSELERILREVIMPGRTFGIAQRWSGIMGMGGSKTPIIEHVSPRVVAAVRLGGMGVAIGIRVARKAAALVQ